MSDWNPKKYLQFRQQRTQPAVDLANRIVTSPKTIVDIGCGPGNSTKVLRKKFPIADILGIDSSENMILRAKDDAENENIRFHVCTADDLDGQYDLLFSNACLQWIPEHEKLLPNLMEKLNDGGCLAVQMPMNQEEPLFQAIKELADNPKWNFESVCFEKNDVLTPSRYYDILSGCSASFDMWETVYYHSLPSHEHLIDWVRSTRLRPYLDALNGDEKIIFEKELFDMVRQKYRICENGDVVLKFRRFFFIACK